MFDAQGALVAEAAVRGDKRGVVGMFKKEGMRQYPSGFPRLQHNTDFSKWVSTKEMYAVNWTRVRLASHCPMLLAPNMPDQGEYIINYHTFSVCKASNDASFWTVGTAAVFPGPSYEPSLSL